MRVYGRSIVAALTLLVTLCAIESAHAVSVTIYNDLSAFTTAAGGTVVTEDFADETLTPPLISIDAPNGLIDGGEFNDRLAPDLIETTFNFSAPIIGFGGNFDLSPGGTGSGISMVIDGFSFAIPQQVPRTHTGEFFGFISDTPFTSLRFTAGTQAASTETYDLDNVALASSVIPSPAAVGVGVICFGMLGLRRPRGRDAMAHQ